MKKNFSKDKLDSQSDRTLRWYLHKHTQLVELHLKQLATSDSFQVLDLQLLICEDHLVPESDSKQTIYTS